MKAFWVETSIGFVWPWCLGLAAVVGLEDEAILMNKAGVDGTVSMLRRDEEDELGLSAEPMDTHPMKHYFVI
jgi:hypothetical protein